jgi:hypothetical protein
MVDFEKVSGNGDQNGQSDDAKDDVGIKGKYA